VACDYGIPYEVLTGDLSQVNFSSARMGWQEFSRVIDVIRWQLLEPRLLNPLVDWFLEAEALAMVRPPAVEGPLWTAPARVLVDETREVPALRDKVRAGFMSLPEAIRSMGYDPETLIQEQAAFLKFIDRMEVKVDSDPRNDYALVEARQQAAVEDKAAEDATTKKETA
jgi:capsid protein